MPPRLLVVVSSRDVDFYWKVILELTKCTPPGWICRGNILVFPYDQEKFGELRELIKFAREHEVTDILSEWGVHLDYYAIRKERLSIADSPGKGRFLGRGYLQAHLRRLELDSYSELMALLRSYHLDPRLERSFEGVLDKLHRRTHYALFKELISLIGELSLTSQRPSSSTTILNFNAPTTLGNIVIAPETAQVMLPAFFESAKTVATQLRELRGDAESIGKIQETASGIDVAVDRQDVGALSAALSHAKALLPRIGAFVGKEALDQVISSLIGYFLKSHGGG